jgi:hypothetical protein
MISVQLRSWNSFKAGGVCQELVPRGTRPAYFCLLVPRVQATVSHNDKED